MSEEMWMVISQLDLEQEENTYELFENEADARTAAEDLARHTKGGRVLLFELRDSCVVAPAPVTWQSTP